VQHMQDQHVVLSNAVEDHILPAGRLRNPGRKSPSRARPM
jgi:hypothetical protein